MLLGRWVNVAARQAVVNCLTDLYLLLSIVLFLLQTRTQIRSDAILAQMTRCHSTTIEDSPVRHTLLEGNNLESQLPLIRSHFGVCHPTLRDCDADLSGPLLYGFSHGWVATDRLKPTQDNRIGWNPGMCAGKCLFYE